MNRFSKVAKAAAMIAALTLSMSGCGASSNGSGSKSSQDSYDKTAIITTNGSEPLNPLAPVQSVESGGAKVATQLFAGLVTYSSDGKPVLDAAESITPNDDSTEWTVKLKSGWTFTNGEKMTSDSFIDSWNYAAKLSNGLQAASYFSNIQGYSDSKDSDLTGVKKVDDLTFTVALNKPESDFLMRLGYVAFAPMPSVAFDDMKAYGEHPIGNGPYKLDSWQHDHSIKLVPNPEYDGPRKAKNAGVTYTLYTNLDSAYADLVAGNLDVLDSIPSSALVTYRGEKAIQPFSKAGPGFKSFTIPQNLKHFTGEEGRLRRAAISMAINRNNIVEKVLRGAATAATDFTAPVIAGYAKDLDKDGVLGYSADQAKQLWAQADAINPWDGTFRLAYSTDSGSKQWVDAIVNSIKNVLGIDAQSYPFPTQKDFSGAVHDRTIDAAFVQGLQSDYPHPEGYLVQAYDSSAADGKGLNNGDYKSGEFDALIDQAARQTTLDGAVEYYHQAEQVLLKDLPVIPLWYGNVTAAAGKQVKNVSFNYMGLPEYQNLTK